MSATIDAKTRALVKQVASDYLRSRGWHVSDYSLEIDREEPRGTMVVDAIHKDDLQQQGRGAGRSIQLHVELAQAKVTKELSYQ